MGGAVRGCGDVGEDVTSLGKVTDGRGSGIYIYASVGGLRAWKRDVEVFRRCDGYNSLVISGSPWQLLLKNC